MWMLNLMFNSAIPRTTLTTVEVVQGENVYNIRSQQVEDQKERLTQLEKRNNSI